ncbi:TAP-like protein-domain-containing protein [Xylariomycetidae sp. FL2044]|nr:TAP-like protein-domain-containing protein [Xylariomycetidae sp. FL2044]KAH9908165.1 TAP-like protein-domain-containing protein [Xylariomycetidae sp. FL2044]
MSLMHILIHAAIASAALAKPLRPRYDRNNAVSGIEWGPCSFEGSLPIECGTLAVPLDYADASSNRTLDLSLVKAAAIHQPSKGSILFNFGGPGYEAIHSLAALAGALANMTGGQHDLIAFDPRGTGNTLPFSCFDDPAERVLYNAKYLLSSGGASDIALSRGFANAEILANICESKGNDLGSLLGTSFVARDLMQVVDSLNEDGLLRFWGFSYGSLLGEVVAAMFPDRMDRVVLDGVVNGHNYFHRHGIDVDQLLATDDAFRTILGACIDAGEKCALSQVNSTALELETTLIALRNKLRDSPIVVGDTIIDYDFVANLYLIVIKYTANIPEAALHINNLLNRKNLTGVVEYSNILAEGLGVGNEALQGIKCSDGVPRSSDLEGVMRDIEYITESSQIFGKDLSSAALVCATWPFEAKERYLGDFKTKTRNPILFIGNTYDPVTPPQSARVMSNAFEGSVMLEQHGFGHSSLSQPSACTSKILQEYFINGNLPEEHTVCEVDAVLFP